MPDPAPILGRRDLLAYSAAFGSAFLAPDARAVPAKDAPKKKYPFKKSINLWAFPYPERMTLEQCLKLAKDAGFDGIELNYDLDNDLSPKSGPKEYAAIRATAEKVCVCSMRPMLLPPGLMTSQQSSRCSRLARSMASSRATSWRSDPRPHWALV